MANDTNIPRNSSLDTSDSNNTANFLPNFYRSDSNKKFLHSTINQLTQPGTVKKVNGYIGRLSAKSTTSADIFINAPTRNRQDYQLEPGLTIDDEMGNTVYLKDYLDYINQLKVFSAEASNHSRLNAQETYSWDPHINWDKFVNFQDYYWLPNGPDVINISNSVLPVESTFTVEVEVTGANSAFVITPDGLTRNPTITLYRGCTYHFEVNTPNDVFSIKTTRGVGSANRYNKVTNNGITTGILSIEIPFNSPDMLYYVSENNINAGGVISILDIRDHSYINVEMEILGKKTYTLSDGTVLSNGMCVAFDGEVVPEKYSIGNFHVSGVGKSIVLTADADLEIISTYTTSESMLFEVNPFDSSPFSNARSYASNIDYIVIDRSSDDKNPWSRYNKWVHKDVIEKSANYNKVSANFNQSYRAVRPIIEFEKNLKLFNFGTTATTDVDLIDRFTTDVFSKIEGSFKYTIDGIPVTTGQRIVFTADTDPLVTNNIYRVEFIDVLHEVDGTGAASRQIRLVLETTPVENQVVLVKDGNVSQGLMYWFNGTTWIKAQQKLTVNQPPLFDVVDENGISFGDIDYYSGSTFNGTSLFSYKVGTGTNDSKLGFPLSYKNINNIGDIVFNFTLINDTFRYETSNITQTKKIDTGFLVVTDNTTTYVNGWLTCERKNTQPAVRVYRNSNKTNNFDIDIFNSLPALSAIEVRVYVNGQRIPKTGNWSIQSTATTPLNKIASLPFHQIVFDTPLKLTDVITIKVFSSIPINEFGHYEVPISLQNNPLNGVLTEFTLGEVIDHVDSIVDNIYLGQNNYQFAGEYPGVSNLRDLGKVTQFGTKFVQHSCPMSLSMYHITSNNNIIRAIEQCRDDYNKFKRSFMVVASSLGVNADTKDHVDLVLNELNSDVASSSPYYFSDMIPYGSYTREDFIVRDPSINIFSLSSVFTLDELSTKAVLVYYNDVQLLHSIDYTFNTQGFVELSIELKVNDEISVYEYSSTDGCLIPETPTKLGCWPKYTPKIFKDTTLSTPRWMLQGHDGSLTLIYGYYDEISQKLVLDYRDELLLELEKRIYNNIKVKYDSKIFDIYDFIPGFSRSSDYSLEEFNQVLLSSYYHWAVTIKQDFSTILSQDEHNSFLYNYSNHSAIDDRTVPGFWRGIYQWMYGTDRPHICPWEMLGFSEEPKWWVEVYGPAPYTNNNLVMWEDISKGVIKEPNTNIQILEKFAKPFLLDYIPVNENGELVSPQTTNIVTGRIIEPVQGDFKFGDISPVEAAWRRSSFYPFSLIKTAVLLAPTKTIGTLFDRSRIKRNLTNQLVYTDTGVRIRLADIKVPSIYSSVTRVQTAGLVNFLINYIDCTTATKYNQYKTDLLTLTPKLCYRVSGFTSKEKFKLLLESRSPSSTGSIFIPQEDYKVVLNTSSPIEAIVYSGVIITKIEGGFEIKGYSTTQPYFKYYTSSVSGSYVTIGGVSAAYSVWTSNQYYLKDRYVKYNDRYFNTNISHVSGDFFEPNYFTALPDLPMVGGERIEFKQRWDNEPITLLYGSKFTSIQQVVDFLLGYGRWLADQGFNFNEFNSALGAVSNWETSAKEFVFWTTQNWGINQPVWSDWVANSTVYFGSIVRYNGQYYKALQTLTSDIFDLNYYLLMTGLNTEGNSVLSLSPAATTLVFSTELSVVDDITQSKYVYEMFDVNGDPIPPNYVNSYRTDNAVSYTTKDDFYIYCASFYLVQKEHVVVINNTTLFNDTVYNPESGYKQDRIKVAGYVSTEWNGSVNVPGFIVDNAVVSEWLSWKDYALGDVVKHRTFYYSASEFIPGVEIFNDSNWIKLSNAPSAKLLPNWNYKATQFTDFYSLDSDNFDTGQQKMAQHLIGYQKRQYLENIIQDDVSEFKFYQGMIIEKGTQNVLNKLFDVLSLDDKESLTFYEEWAIRTGCYGACAAFNTVEFKLDESEFRSNPQGFELVTLVDKSVDDHIIRFAPADVYVTPNGYTPKLWTKAKPRNNLLRSCGHVRESEVVLILKSLSDIITSTSTLTTSDYVWCTFEGASWDVYQLVAMVNTAFGESSDDPTPMRVDRANNYAIFKTRQPHPFKDGDYIKFTDMNDIPNVAYHNKCFKVSTTDATGQLPADEFRIEVHPSTILEMDVLSNMSIDLFVSRRHTSKDSNDVPLSNGTVIWTDNYIGNDGKWATWKRINNNWIVQHTAVEKPDVSKIKQAFLYNRVSNQLIKHLDVVDSASGKNPIIADQEVKFKSFYDPAVYNTSTATIIETGVNVDADIPWDTAQIGTLWWDLRTAKFIDSYADDVVYRNSTWSTLAYGASIDVYEWVESKSKPSVWDAAADTDNGLASGISGKSLYGDLYYSRRQKYDSISQRYSYTYYFWVKNKITIPNVAGRKISAYDVANLIANPRGEGYAYLALTGLDSFSLVNVKSNLTHDNVVLSVEYWITDKVDQNIHTQWKIISTNENTVLPANIEQKWFDSLCGYDMQDREVPDLTLPVRLQYGLENRPRQSMFVNRCEILKQLVEQANLVFLKNLITDTRNIANLSTYDQIPNINRGLYDSTIDTDLELRLTIPKSYIKPIINPVIVDGKIVGIDIVNPGRGYLTSPYATISGSGTGAVVKLTINSIGQITGCDVIHSGSGYNTTTVLTVRSYSVLIKSDATSNNGWSIYEYDRKTELWTKNQMQSFDTRKYWHYVDWYDTGYNQYTASSYSVNTYSELSTINTNIGDIVNVRTTSSNRWVLLKKYASVNSFDWTQSYKIVGSQNGTIQLSSLLYDFIDTTIGYEGFFYDQGVYDNGALNELRIILNAIKNDLFIDDLRSEYLKLFFTCVRGALSEQTYVDWIFKTSFVNVMHNVGSLHTSVTYRNDNLSNFEEYVNEVKPYRTQVREYVSLYDKVDTSYLITSDFDVPSEYSSLFSLEDNIVVTDDILSYPTKSWFDNVGFSVTSIKVINGGSGYISEPTVLISSLSGTGATARAYIANGKVSRISVLTTGSQYLSIPEITLTGGLPGDGVAAIAIPILGNSVVRSNLINLKFDRINNSYVMDTLNCTDTFTGTGELQFKLTWAPDIRISNSSVTVKGVLQLRDTYILKSTKTTVNGYDVYVGSITFVTAPKGTIVVTYLKDVSTLTAVDRIQYYYNPRPGDLGKDLSQLMTGIEYAGVTVSGLNFNKSVGWGSDPFYTGLWDSFKPTIDDYQVTVSQNTHSIQLPYIPTLGSILNVYYSYDVVTQFNTDGKTLGYNYLNYEHIPEVSLHKLAEVLTTANISDTTIQLVSVNQIKVGDVVSRNENNVWTVAMVLLSTASAHNYLTVKDTSILYVNMPLLFTGKAFGGLVKDHTYYVREIHSNNTTEFTISSTINGSEVAVTNATGKMTIIAGEFKYNTVVKSIDTTNNTVTLSETINTVLLAQTELKFSRVLVKHQDFSSISRSKLLLKKQIPIGMVLSVSGKREVIRLDDIDFGGPNVTNRNAIMMSHMSDGVSSVVTIPSSYIDINGDVASFVVNNGDTFTIRNSTSSGAEAEYDIDTSINGGTFAANSAAGIAASDIVIDGSTLVNQETDAGPEEVVPGHLVDAVAIKIYDKDGIGSYMQFKDMLNRTHFKRLNADKRTTLAVDLLQTDEVIEVTDASLFDLPSPEQNKPGVIDINGERIEFFTVENNTLGQLRRGTLGTGVPTVHSALSIAQELSAGETMPNQDKILVEQYESDGTRFVDLSYLPTKSKNWKIKTTTLAVDLLDTDTTITVTDASIFKLEPDVPGVIKIKYERIEFYSINGNVLGDIKRGTDRTVAAVHLAGAIVQNISTASYGQCDDVEVIINGISLKKVPYQIHDGNKNAISPLGNIQYDADFSVDGKTKQLRLTHAVPVGTLITVIKRTGIDWSLPIYESVINRFLNAVPGSTYTYEALTFNSEEVTFDDDNTKF